MAINRGIIANQLLARGLAKAHVTGPHEGYTMPDLQGRSTPGETRGTGLYAPDATNRPLIFLGSAVAIILVPCTIIALVVVLTAIGLTALLATAIAAPLVLVVTGVIVRLRQMRGTEPDGPPRRPRKNGRVLR